MISQHVLRAWLCGYKFTHVYEIMYNLCALKRAAAGILPLAALIALALALALAKRKEKKRKDSAMARGEGKRGKDSKGQGGNWLNIEIQNFKYEDGPKRCLIFFCFLFSLLLQNRGSKDARRRAVSACMHQNDACM